MKHRFVYCGNIMHAKASILYIIAYERFQQNAPMYTLCVWRKNKMCHFYLFLGRRNHKHENYAFCVIYKYQITNYVHVWYLSDNAPLLSAQLSFETKRKPREVCFINRIWTYRTHHLNRYILEKLEWNETSYRLECTLSNKIINFFKKCLKIKLFNSRVLKQM
jgi:hypothetical protein